MAEAPRVSIVIPVWNLWEMTSACLRSLAEHTSGENIEVVVADNASADATARELEPLGQELFGKAFRAVRLPENLGFAKGCNAGARAASGDLLFFLNNDTTVTPNWLPPLRASMADARIGAAGPLLLYPDGTVQHCGIFVSPFHKVGHLYEGLPGSFAPARRHHPLQAITGAALMVRKNEFEACGGFHEGYQNGYEDMDLCFALRGMGLKLKVESSSIVYHHTSQTPGRSAHDQANGRLFSERFGAAVRPDEHVLGALDGYRLCIGPRLATWFALPEEKERQWTLEFDGAAFDEAACRARLAQEPLWRGGWILLAGHMDKSGNGQEALRLLDRCAQLFPEPQVNAALLRLARRMDVQGEILADIEAEVRLANSAEDKLRVQQARKAAYASGDAALARLLGDWLLSYASA